MGVPKKALSIAIILSLVAGCSTQHSEMNDTDITATNLESTETDSLQESAWTDGGEPTEVSSATDEVGTSDVALDDATEPTESTSVMEEGKNAEYALDTEDDGSQTNLEAQANLEAPVTSELQSEESAQLTAQADSIQAALRIDSIRFQKSAETGGEIEVELTDEAAYEIKRTTPTEYVLTIPGAKVAQAARITQVAPPGFPGIRSVRVIDTANVAQVRMFVDEGVVLAAKPSGKRIFLSAIDSNVTTSVAPALQSGARAQLAGDQKTVETSDETARANPTGFRSSDGSKVYTGRLISLDLQETDIDNALRIIAEVSNLNIIASEDVRGKVTLRLIDVPWDQALDVILKTNGLDQVTEGNVIRIAPVEKLREERQALLEAKEAAEALEDLQVRYIRVSYARVSEMQEQVEAVLSERGSVAVDERTNQLIIKDIEKGQEAALGLIEKLDLRTPQILLETQIVEAEKNLLRSLGFQWNYGFNQGPETGNSTGLVFPNSISTDASSQFAASNVDDTVGTVISAVLDSADGSRLLSARLSAFENEGLAKIVSRPQVATVNNKLAEIKSVEKIRVRLPSSGTSVATGAGASASGGASSAVDEIDVGIELRVTPQASPDFYVLMDVEAKSSTLGALVVDDIPSTIEREATSTVLVKSGQTFALGGVYRIEDNDSVRGIPFLKDVPVIGHLFRGMETRKSDEELIFFITPHIVEGSFDASLM